MTVKATVRDWMARLAGAKTALTELHQLDRQLREQHAAAQKERERIVELPPPLQEILANMEALVDAQAAHEAESLARSLRSDLGGGLELQIHGNLIERRPRLPSWIHAELTFSRLCALAPDFVKERWAAILRAVPYEVGTPLKDRMQLVAEAEERIAEIERDHEQLVEQAASFDPPVVLQLLPEVKQRRDAEAWRQRRDEAAAQAREEAKARADAAAPMGPAVSSPYLSRER